VGGLFFHSSPYPLTTVAEQYGVPSRAWRHWDAPWAGWLAAELGLSALLQRYPEQLSGGQQQRVARWRARWRCGHP